MTALDRLAKRRDQAIPRLVGRLSQRDGLVQQPVTAMAGPRVRVRGRWLLNFVGTNYLGLNRDPRIFRAVVRTARVWGTFLGMPRALAGDRLSSRLEKALAQLVGQMSALVFPSTTHIALDIWPLLAGKRGVLFVDEWAYPISLEGARAAVRKGARLRRFPHNDHRALARLLKMHTRAPDKVIVCDGVYPADGHPAPLHMFARLARENDSVVYVDDAHGIGIVGARPARGMPYGRGGGGIGRYYATLPGVIVHVGSLSKAFSAPLAFVAGPTPFINYVRATAPSYLHSSPPDLPTVAAAFLALRINRSEGGDARRRVLIERVASFRRGLQTAGISLAASHLFPVQTLHFDKMRAAEAVGRDLRRRGVWAILQFSPPDKPKGAALRFVITALHRHADIDYAVRALARCLVKQPTREISIPLA